MKTSITDSRLIDPQSRTRSLRALLPALALMGLAAACGTQAAGTTGSAEPPVSGDTVVLSDNTFQPDALLVAPGTTITWVWDDGAVPHNVTFESFASGAQREGSWAYTFTDPYDYVCTLHPAMTGSITVG